MIYKTVVKNHVIPKRKCLQKVELVSVQYCSYIRRLQYKVTTLNAAVNALTPALITEPKKII